MRDIVARFLGAVFLIGIVSLVVGSVLGQPILLSYVETDSMEPTLDPGDGFIAVPPAIAGPVNVGDVIVFRAERLHGGGFTTHRVVKETKRGYITKGDANPFTDQSGVEPPVKKAQIVAVALQVNGHVVVIPELGTVITGIRDVLASIQRRAAIILDTRLFLGAQGLAYLLFAASLVWYGVAAWRDRSAKSRHHDRTRETGVDIRLVVGAFAALIVLGATASMVGPAGTQEYGVVSAEFNSPGARVIPTGESETMTLPVANDGVLPVAVFLEAGSNGIDVQPRELHLRRGEVANATVTLSAPPETGYYRRFLVTHRYLAILPQAHLRALYHVHPWLPIIVIDALIGIPFYLFGIALVGTGRIRERNRDTTTETTLRRHVRRLYR